LTACILRDTALLIQIQMTEDDRDWINSLRDRTARARIQVRIDRLVHGPGLCRHLTDGVGEVKIDYGPGYRVNFTERGGILIVLLAGGDKSSQNKDIQRAIALAKSLQEWQTWPKQQVPR